MSDAQNTLSAMTGFARISGTHDGTAWQWEARSVNGRTLDLRTKLPPDHTNIDAAVRKAFSAHFTRGNIQISLTLSPATGQANVSIDEALFDQLVSFIHSKGGNSNLAPLMTIEGVVSQNAALDDDARKALQEALLLGARDCAKALKAARDSEGAALSPLFDSAVSQMETLTKQAETAAATQPASIAARLTDQIKALDIAELGADRMAAEIALLAAKADVREETDRLRAHCEQARDLLAQGSPIGRKLDFLSQEFNRETNTLCAKSADIALTRIGLEMKSVIEQFREQAANVE